MTLLLISAPAALIVQVGGRTAADMLVQGGIDAAFLVADPKSGLIQELIRTPGIRLLNLERAEAYFCQHYFLTRVTLPRGVFDLQRDIPDHDIQMIAAPGATGHLRNQRLSGPRRPGEYPGRLRFVTTCCLSRTFCDLPACQKCLTRFMVTGRRRGINLLVMTRASSPADHPGRSP